MCCAPIIHTSTSHTDTQTQAFLRTCIYVAVVRSFALNLFWYSLSSFVWPPPLLPYLHIRWTYDSKHLCTHICAHMSQALNILHEENETAEPMLTNGLFGRFALAVEWQKPHLQAFCFVSFAILFLFKSFVFVVSHSINVVHWEW